MAKTIKVRIPAVVAPDGRWCAYGYQDAMKDPDWSMVEEVADAGEYEGAYLRIWITAELPVPETVDVAAGAIEPA
ncbi:hypothetical protein ABIB94_007114 [Bradyrhizobium sp. JR7.2]|uniref:hypothetical protein n=1 Tax=Bradyrhizobium sp. JR7.2 TaxID=3156375 RepID=UPI003393587C